jgi:ribosomal-protein-alanine N-acetyltransferase
LGDDDIMDETFGDLPVLETPRLRLRKLTLTDADDVFAYASDPEVTRYMLWSPHASIEDSGKFIKVAIERYNKGMVAPWGIEHKGDRKIIGTCDFISWFPEHSRTEIGYALSRSYWGRGIMTEAVTHIIACGFGRKNVNRIQAMCEIPNVGSARVMEKSGMVFEGILRQYMQNRGACRDVKMYAILKEDWLLRLKSGL